MRKYLKVFLLAGIFAVLLCGSALAAEPTTGGIYGLRQSPNVNVNLEPLTATGETKIQTSEVTIGGQTVTDYYADAVRIRLTYSGITGECLTFTLSDDTGVPTTGNIVYIDQQTSSSGSATFTLYPSSLASGKVYHIWASTTQDALKELGSFTYYAPYKLGDVNSDKQVDSGDALDVLLHFAGTTRLSGNSLLAADVNADTQVDSGDALDILLYFAGTLKEFGK